MNARVTMPTSIDALDREQASEEHLRAARRTRWIGYACLVAFAGGFGAWSVGATIGGAVIAPASFVVDTNVKKVQHQLGGIVSELRIREGDKVDQGELMVRLDDTVARANQQIVAKQLDELWVRAARLEAERDQGATVKSPPQLAARMHEAEVRALLDEETRLFAIRASAREGLRSQLRKRVAQLRAEIEGYEEQRAAKIKEHALIQRELVGVRDLFRQNLVQITRLSQLEREAAALEGLRGQLSAQIAQAKGKIAETELQMLQLTEDLRAEAMKEFREIQGRISELLERRVAAEDQLKRMDIRAPAAGYVHQMQVHTIGGVITPAEPVMLIVPSGDALQLEARVATTDYDQVWLGQPAVVRLHAFNQRTTPELNGKVARLSADVSRDPQTGTTFYVIRIAVPKEEIDRLLPLQVSAGMQADAYLKTQDRTPLSYLARPIADQFAKAFKER